MRSSVVTRDSRLLFWRRVRDFAVPGSMIEAASARRAVGDWAGACAAARVDVDLNLRDVARAHGGECAAHVRADLRRLAPDLLRWHLPRIAPDGLLRPGLTIPLARYPDRGVQLVARTPPAWADAGQRISLALWDRSRSRDHPHPHPSQWFRLDLHRHLWDAQRVDELRQRSGADQPPGPPGCAVDRWPDEAMRLLRADGRTGGEVVVRLGGRRRLVLDVGTEAGRPVVRITTGKGGVASRSCLPDAATWVPPDLELLRLGLIDVDRLHPLVGPALAPGRPPPRGAQKPDVADAPRVVECRGARHRIGLVDRVLVPLDHDPDDIRREELLAALGGVPMPCLQAIDEIHRRPESLVDIRARLDHGDVAGALAVIEALLGPDALLRHGPLREELETAAARRVAHGLFRAGLVGLGPTRSTPRRRDVRARPRFASTR